MKKAVKDLSELIGKYIEVTTKAGITYVGKVTYLTPSPESQRGGIELSDVHLMPDDDWPVRVADPIKIFLDSICSYSEARGDYPRRILERWRKTFFPYVPLKYFK
jgi:hypothetical protein